MLATQGKKNHRYVLIAAVIALGITTTPASVSAQAVDCTCRLAPLFNLGTFFIYNGSFRDTCKTPDGQGNCSPPVDILLSGPPGLPQQACENGECEGDPASSAASVAPGNNEWALQAAYPADFSLNSISNSNPAYFALFPSGERPTKAVRQDFTIKRRNGGPVIYVRIYRAKIRVHESLPGGKVKTVVYDAAPGVQFDDNDPSDNIEILLEETEPGTAGQEFCRTFQHTHQGDRQPTTQVMLLVDPKKAE